jgi:hypothetical protein
MPGRQRRRRNLKKIKVYIKLHLLLITLNLLFLIFKAVDQNRDLKVVTFYCRIL